MYIDHFRDIDYGNGMAEVIHARDDGERVVIRLEGEHAATEAFVVAGALNDTVNRAYGRGYKTAVNDTLTSLANQSLLLDGE